MRRKFPFLLGVLAILLLACTCPFTTFLPSTSAPETPQSPGTQTGTPTLAPAPTVDNNQSMFSYPFSDRSLFVNALTPSTRSVLQGLPDVTVYHIALSIADIPAKIAGVEEVLYTNTEDTVLTEVDFAIFANILGGSIEVTNLRVDRDAVTPQYQTGVMRVPLSQGLLPRESVLISLDFNVTIPSMGGDFYYGIFGYNANILSLAHACPTILVYNAEGWNNQIPDMDGDPLFVDTSFYFVSVNAPADLILVASGSEVERSETAGRQLVQYADGPARDFYLAASRDLVKFSGIVDGITVNSYALPGSEASGQKALDVALDTIDLFNSQYGQYPYTEFDIAPINTSAGGVEYPGLTVIALDNYNDYSSDYLELVVVHEIAHQWFYNLVGNDNQDQPWLDESLAEFLTWEYYRLHRGADAASAFELQNRAWWQSASDPQTPIGMSVSDYNSYDYGAIVYGKGPFFFDALRDQIGQSVFDELMRDYVATYSWKVATTNDFKALAEQHCGCDLTNLFDEWVTSK